MFLFEKLKVYQCALSFAECITSLTSDFPRGCWFLADQLNRASLSISLNIAEGNGRWSDAERHHFFGIARGSLHECVPLIELCRRKNLIREPICIELRARIEEISKMLSGLIEWKRTPACDRERLHAGKRGETRK
jgi:four helix bundle protein